MGCLPTDWFYQSNFKIHIRSYTSVFFSKPSWLFWSYLKIWSIMSLCFMSNDILDIGSNDMRVWARRVTARHAHRASPCTKWTARFNIFSRLSTRSVSTDNFIDHLVPNINKKLVKGCIVSVYPTIICTYTIDYVFFINFSHSLLCKVTHSIRTQSALTWLINRRSFLPKRFVLFLAKHNYVQRVTWWIKYKS